MLIADDLDRLLDILPDFVRNSLYIHPRKKSLIEVVMDLGRKPEARFPDGPQYLSRLTISWHDLDYSIKKIPNFSNDNRSGIECTLHRISSIKNRKGNIVGLTCRVGRAIFGTSSMVRDLLYLGKSILLLGKPGVGKTTAIREIARVLADEMEKRVVIIDTSNEIAGDGDIPHPAIGRARRMQVAKPELQHQVMIEAVENHMPEVIIIDEIGTELEVLAARTIAERGVQLVGTAHGNYLESVIKNPTLSDLIGGIQYVTLGDNEAKRRGSQKSILERKTVPAFQVAIEIHKRDTWIIHKQVDKFVDLVLQGSILFIERRSLNLDGSISVHCQSYSSTNFIYYGYSKVKNLSTFSNLPPTFSSIFPENNLFNGLNNVFRKLPSDNELFNVSHKTSKVSTKSNSCFVSKLYVYGINVQQTQDAINALDLPIVLTRDIIKANYILALRSYIKQNNKIRDLAKSQHIVIYTVERGRVNNIARALKQMIYSKAFVDAVWKKLSSNKELSQLQMLAEVRFAVEKIILIHKQSVQLLPKSSNSLKLQSKLVEMYNFRYTSFESRGHCRLIIYPN